MDDVFAVQDEIAAAIAGMLEAKLSSSALKRVPSNVAAHEGLLKARYFMYQHRAESMTQAETYFQQAIALDPAYATAHAAYAEYLFHRVQVGMVPAHEGMPRMRAEARKALELDRSLAEAHAMLAGVAALYEYDWEEAQRRYEQALAAPALAPWSRAFCALWVLRLMGRFEEAVQQARLAVQDDPLNPQLHNTLAFALMGAGRLAEAQAQFQQVFELAPGFPPSMTGTALLLASQGRHAEAQAWMEKSFAVTPDAPYVLGSLAGLLLRNRETARSEELVSRIRGGPAHRVNVALLYYYLYLGDVERTADHVEQAITERYTGLAIGLMAEIARPLRESARWPKLARMMNLPA